MSEYTAQEVAEIFGVELEETGEQDGQAGAGDTQDADLSAGAETQEDAGEAEGSEAEDTAQQDDGDGEGEETDPTAADVAPAMDPEERHRQAAARRAREEAARAAAEQARVDQVYARMFAGQTNPYTGKPITSEADFLAYEQERSRKEREAELQKAGISPETVKSIVDQELAPVREQLQQTHLATIQEKARLANQRAQAAVEGAIRNISAIMPEVKSLDDIAAMPTAPVFHDYIKKGIGLEDAFYLANRQEIETRKLAAARTAGAKAGASRGHLDPVVQGGGKAPVEVPAAAAEAYRAMNPEATNEEIQREYAKFIKDLKK